MRRHWKLLLGTLAAVLLALAVAGYVWLSDLVDPMPETAAALVSDDLVRVETDRWLSFTPSEPSDIGFILYPGARVPAQAYAPPARAIAEAGHLSVVPSMPFGLAILAPDTASDVIEAHPEIERWVIAGHSLGGVVAADYAADHEAIGGLALWASYPADGTDLSDAALAVTSIYGSEDGLTTIEDIDASRDRLPSDTAFVEIAGGTHAGFGWYGEQTGDGEATITRDEQQAQIVAATLRVLEAVEDV